MQEMNGIPQMVNRNKNWRDVPLPDLMRNLPKDRRGLPIPFIVLRDRDQRPHFTVNDTSKTIRCLKDDLCPICGQKLHRGRWFVGGPLSAFHPDGWYFDTPMHADCMRYALSVCPYLAASKYTGRLEDLTVDPERLPDGVVALKNVTIIPERPEIFVAVMSIGQETKMGASMHPCVRPKKRVRYEYWRFGEQLPDAEGYEIAQRIVAGSVHRI